MAVDRGSHQQTVDKHAALLQLVEGFLVGTVEGKVGYLHHIVILVIKRRVAFLLQLLILTIGILEVCLVAIEELDIEFHGFRKRKVFHILLLHGKLFRLGDILDGPDRILDTKQLGQVALGNHRKLGVTVFHFVESLDEILFCPTGIVAGAIDVSHQGSRKVVILYILVSPDIGIEILGSRDGSEQILLLDVIESLVGFRLIIGFPVVRTLQKVFEGKRMLIESAVVALVIERTELTVHS